VKLLWEWWLQIWPNLAASVIALPFAFAWHHRKVKAHVDAAVQRQANAGPTQVTVNWTGKAPGHDDINALLRRQGPGGGS
jgi:hypothetical protein